MGRLTMIGPTVARASTAAAVVPPKTVDRFYQSAEWEALRKACLERDRYKCQIAIPGCCTGKASIADHVISRKNGGPDTLSNLRAACRACDNRVKEDHLGRRRGGAGGG